MGIDASFDTIIVRYSEIGLKGQNRPLFEKKLMENIRDCLKKNGISGTASRAAGRIIVKTGDKAALNCLVRVFGIHSLSPAKTVSVTGLEKEASALAQEVLTNGKSFAVRAKRLKKVGKPSTELNNELGRVIVASTGARVDLGNPGVVFGIELFGDKAFLFTETIKGFGGLPVGIEGNVRCLMENENSLLACLLAMKRGCAVSLMILPGYGRAQTSLIETQTPLIEKFAYGFKVESKIINDFSEIGDAAIVVVGQTLEDFRELDIKASVLRPLIAYDKTKIRETLRRFEDAAIR